MVGRGRPGTVASSTDDRGGLRSRGAGWRSIENSRRSQGMARGGVGSGSGQGCPRHGDRSASTLDHKPHLGLYDCWRTCPRVYEPYVLDARGWVSISVAFRWLKIRRKCGRILKRGPVYGGMIKIIYAMHIKNGKATYSSHYVKASRSKLEEYFQGAEFMKRMRPYAPPITEQA
ncbi:carotenoid 9,10(9',10')-cleavage dioxygenase [Iris pallida]|uniref:Carotenoid 9,10(9',10')-cleavage dioxygenase n=1 Tax=Iris pallida TaxID=29817 RepID=A0AAX6EQD5_IRIPA|nr:carotenoid 9,10(9',10')-cleavage dioxygenase [Iris pallida]